MTTGLNRIPIGPRHSLDNRSQEEEVWRLRDSHTGRVQTCQLRDTSRAGAGWEVHILEAGEIGVAPVRERTGSAVRCGCGSKGSTTDRFGTQSRKAARDTAAAQS